MIQKKRVVGIVLLLAVLPVAGLFAQQLDLGELLVDYESHMRWEAVVDEWADERDYWVEFTLGLESAGEFGEALVFLETHMTWDAVDGSWADIREDWVDEALSADNLFAHADLLATLEAYTLWDAMFEEWADRRDPWLETLAAVELY